MKLAGLIKNEGINVLSQAEASVHAVYIIWDSTEDHIALYDLLTCHAYIVDPIQLFTFVKCKRLQMDRPCYPVIQPAGIVQKIINDP